MHHRSLIAVGLLSLGLFALWGPVTAGLEGRVAYSSADDEDAEETAITVLYTIHNEGYIEPCG